jgi:hypothetical protein
MPEEWIPNCGTQLERAIRALFIEKGAASVADCFISNDSTERADLADGLTTVRAFQSTTNEAELSGNETFQVVILNEFWVRGSPNEENLSLNRVRLDERVGRQMRCLLQAILRDGATTDSGTLDGTCADITSAGRALATQDAVNDADMTEFTCLKGRYLGMARGEPADQSCSWAELRNFEFTVCPANVD